MKRMKKVLVASIIAALAAVGAPFSAFASQDPTYASVYYFDQELLDEFGSSAVIVPFTSDDNAVWKEVDNSFKFLMIDGTIEKDSKIFTESGYSLVPIRLVSDKLGAEVNYDADTKKITITKGETELVLVSGEDTALVNGQEEQLGVAVKNEDGTTYVPIRFIVENLGGAADYNTFDTGADSIRIFPTVAIDSAEFLALERMSDEEALEKAREQLLATLPELEEYIGSLEYEPSEFEERMAEIKADLENIKLSGKFVSCYVVLETKDYSKFLVNTITGEVFSTEIHPFYHQIKTLEPYDLGNSYFFN